MALSSMASAKAPCSYSRLACLFIGWFEVNFMVPLFACIIAVACVASGGRPVELWVVAVAFLVLGAAGMLIVGPGCLVYGLSTDKPSLLVPYLVIGVLKSIALAIGSIVMFATLPSVTGLGLLVLLAYEIFKLKMVHFEYKDLVVTKDHHPTVENPTAPGLQQFELDPGQSTSSVSSHGYRQPPSTAKQPF